MSLIGAAMQNCAQKSRQAGDVKVPADAPAWGAFDSAPASNADAATWVAPRRQPTVDKIARVAVTVDYGTANLDLAAPPAVRRRWFSGSPQNASHVGVPSRAGPAILESR
jgi:hypothetical protein